VRLREGARLFRAWREARSHGGCAEGVGRPRLYQLVVRAEVREGGGGFGGSLVRVRAGLRAGAPGVRSVGAGGCGRGVRPHVSGLAARRAVVARAVVLFLAARLVAAAAEE
jgi:hypothetical protein